MRRWYLSRRMRRRASSRVVPLGRTSIAVAFAAALGFVAYSFAKDGVRSPFSPAPYRLTVHMDDAAGLDPQNEPPVYVAGVHLGRVVDVRFHDGRAEVSMELDPEARGRVFRDATLRIRPQNAANILSVAVSPGTPQAGALPSGAIIPPSRAKTPVTPAEALSTMDADTRAQLALILAGSRDATRDRGGDIAAALRQIASSMAPAQRVSAQLARRRTLAAQLVTEIDTMFTTLGDRRRELSTAIAASHRLLRASASQDRQLAQALRDAPATLDELERTLAEFRAAEPGLSAALQRAEPVARRLGPTLRAIRALTPEVTTSLSAVGSLTRTADPAMDDLLKVTRGMQANSGAMNEQLALVERIIGALDENKATMAGGAASLSGAFGQQDNRSPITKAIFFGIAVPKPSSFGLPETPAGRSRLRRLLPEAVDLMCGDPELRCGRRLMRMANGRRLDGRSLTRERTR